VFFGVDNIPLLIGQKGVVKMKTYEFGNPDSDIVLIQPVDDHDLEGIENEFMTIVNSCDMSFLLIAVRIKDEMRT
jgi:hypothetical protein